MQSEFEFESVSSKAKTDRAGSKKARHKVNNIKSNNKKETKIKVGDQIESERQINKNCDAKVSPFRHRCPSLVSSSLSLSSSVSGRLLILIRLTAIEEKQREVTEPKEDKSGGGPGSVRSSKSH